MSEKLDLIKQDGFWGEHEIPANLLVTCKIGPLNLWCKRIEDELWVAFEHNRGDGETDAGTNEPSQATTWSRWVLTRKKERICFRPVFPDRAVVVKPEYPFRIVRGAKAKIYVRVPLWNRIEKIDKENTSLVEIPTVILSNTWFGTFTEGELCYWISTAARRQIEVDPSRSFLAICPLQIINRSEEDLSVEKLALDVVRLSVFKLHGQLWSNEMRINYHGSEDISRIEISGKAPLEAQGAELISGPRNAFKKSFAKKTFTTIKELPGLGLLVK